MACSIRTGTWRGGVWGGVLGRLLGRVDASNAACLREVGTGPGDSRAKPRQADPGDSNDATGMLRLGDRDAAGFGSGTLPAARRRRRPSRHRDGGSEGGRARGRAGRDGLDV
ncbi:hypothetical protein BT67DRAFT_256690 [Trichocladium antarcticum]|uniref:Uncharacterized protein n=1 Tax=Trichocladium antarcticum TaxID=1450529 RepID=A0AAN6ZE10_9PEZI|nr:hypothetical protein BT67DRAFT_256690 [Trichocladium antarcticum]